MIRKIIAILILILCLGLILTGCPKKTVMKEEPSVKKTEEPSAESERLARLEAEKALREKELAAERERLARLEAQRKEKEAEDLSRLKEEEAKRALAEKELAAERERLARLEAQRKEKEAEDLSRLKEEEAKRALAEKELAAERERLARLEAERKEKESRELARLKEEEAKRALAEKELAAEREKLAKLEEERELMKIKEKELKAKEEEARRALAEKEKEFEKSLVAKKYPGIEGEVFESKLLKDIHFDFDRYEIRLEDAEILKENTALLIKYPDANIQIEGHCDERGTIEYNLALGERRANSTRMFLISQGISADRISTISYGEERPQDPSHTEEAWAKNRRCHFVIMIPK
jgi:peptidoglycan-associated lipoprotein